MSGEVCVLPVPTSSITALYEVGTPVLALHRAKFPAWPATITALFPGRRSFSLHYQDGFAAKKISVSHIIPQQRPRQRRVADPVLAEFRGSGSFWPAHVTKVYSDGTCDVAFDDGDVELRAKPAKLSSGWSPNFVLPPSSAASEGERGGRSGSNGKGRKGGTGDTGGKGSSRSRGGPREWQRRSSTWYDPLLGKWRRYAEPDVVAALAAAAHDGDSGDDGGEGGGHGLLLWRSAAGGQHLVF